MHRLLVRPDRGGVDGAGHPGRLRLLDRAEANDGVILERLVAVLERSRPDGDRDRAVALFRVENARRLRADVVAHLEVLLSRDHQRLDRRHGELDRLVQAAQAVDLHVVFEVGHLADGAESRRVEINGIARLHVAPAVEGFELRHGVFHLQAADLPLAIDRQRGADVSAVADVFAFRPGRVDARRRPGPRGLHRGQGRRRGRRGQGRQRPVRAGSANSPAAGNVRKDVPAARRLGPCRRRP